MTKRLQEELSLTEKSIKEMEKWLLILMAKFDINISDSDFTSAIETMGKASNAQELLADSYNKGEISLEEYSD